MHENVLTLNSFDKMPTKEKVVSAIAMQEWLENHVTEVWADYCTIFGIHSNYAQSFEFIQNMPMQFALITFDASYYGGSDIQSKTIPLEYIYAETVEIRRELILRDKAAHDEEVDKVRALEQSNKRDTELTKLRELKAKYPNE